jgi:hypothetical protein
MIISPVFIFLITTGYFMIQSSIYQVHQFEYDTYKKLGAIFSPSSWYSKS